MQIVSRWMARHLGLSHYFTGKPCCRGHIAERLVGDKTCVECDLLRRRGKPAHKARCRAYYEAHREEMIAQAMAYQRSRPEWDAARRQRYRDRKAGRIAAAH